MIYSKKEFEKKLIDKDLNRKKLAKMIDINVNTLRLKIEDIKYEFKISEAEKIANILELSNEEMLRIFFGKELAFDESFNTAV